MKNKVFTLVFAFLAMAGNAIWGQSGPTEINITGIESQLPTPSSGTGWTLSHGDIASEGNKLIISENGNYIISDNADGASDNSNIQIIVNGNLDNVFITVKNVKTNAQLNNDLDGADTDEKYSDRCAFEIGSGSKVTLNWVGENKFWSSPERAGINVKPNATLILAGPDEEGNSLEAGSLCNTNDSNTNGAGIGGDEVNANFGTIIIESGHIKARCESKGTEVDAQAAGIGGGYDPDGKAGTSGSIIIKGGTVEAACWSNDKGQDYNGTNGNDYAWGAGIGGGMGGTVDNIIILGGNVKAYSTQGDDIGTGEYYYNDSHPNIIIGKAEKDGNTQVGTTDSNTLVVDDTNYLDGLNDKTVTGEVTMLDGLQIYVEDLKVNDGATFSAYNFNLIQTKIQDGDDDHDLDDGKEEFEASKHYYFGANATFEIPKLGCTNDHLFMGWYYSKNSIIYTPKGEEGKTTFETPSEKLTNGIQKESYQAVWVDNEYSILVSSGTVWDGTVESNTPTITIIPQNANVKNRLDFSITTELENVPELDDLEFDSNELHGTPTLQENEAYFTKDIEVSVTLGEGENSYTDQLTLHITIVSEVKINSVNVTSNATHIYNGQHHNGYNPNEDNHSLTVSMTHIDETTTIDEEYLTEGVGYRIYSFTFTNGNTTTSVTAPSNNKKASALIVDAGTYSDIKIQALNAIFDDNLTTEEDFYTIPSGKIEVEKRKMDIDIALKNTELIQETIAHGGKLNWENMLNIIPEEQNETRGLITGEDIIVSGDIEYTLDETGANAIISITNINIEKATDDSKFKESNYEITVDNKPYTADLEVKINVPLDAEEENDDTDRPGHIDRPAKYYNIYIDTVCPGLKLELSKDVVKEGGQVSVYLTVEEQCDTTGFTFEYKRGLKKWWQDLKPLEGVQPGEYIIKNIYSDIYIQALDAILEIEEEPTGIEDVEGAKVYAKEGTIYVYTPNHERVMIVSMNGAIVKSAEQEGMQSYSLNRGIYIVRIGDKVFKIKN